MRFAYIFVLFTVNYTIYASNKIFINIGEAELKRPVISVISESPKSKICLILKKIIKKDMWFANLFTILPKKLEPEKKNSIISWKASGVEYLISIRCTSKIQLKVYHLPKLSPIIDKSIRKTINIRPFAHKISEYVYKELTGESSIFMSKIAFIGRTKINGRYYKNLFISDYDGHRIQQLTHYKTISVSPAWSPDATKIAYTRFAKTKIKGRYIFNPNIYIYDLITRREKLISNFPGQNSGAAWSRDGKKLAFTINKRRDPDIYYYDFDTKKIKLLIGTRGLDVEPSFSPNDSELVFSSSRTGNPELYVLNLKTKKQTRLTYIRHYNSSPAWSPKSDIIAFAGLDNPFMKGRSNFDIFLVKSDASKVERLTIASGNNEDPTWSPDARHLIYTSTRFHSSDLFLIHFDGTGDTRLTKGRKLFSPDWSKNFKDKYYY